MSIKQKDILKWSHIKDYETLQYKIGLIQEITEVLLITDRIAYYLRIHYGARRIKTAENTLRDESYYQRCLSENTHRGWYQYDVEQSYIQYGFKYINEWHDSRLVMASFIVDTMYHAKGDFNRIFRRLVYFAEHAVVEQPDETCLILFDDAIQEILTIPQFSIHHKDITQVGKNTHTLQYMLVSRFTTNCREIRLVLLKDTSLDYNFQDIPYYIF